MRESLAVCVVNGRSVWRRLAYMLATAVLCTGCSGDAAAPSATVDATTHDDGASPVAFDTVATPDGSDAATDGPAPVEDVADDVSEPDAAAEPELPSAPGNGLRPAPEGCSPPVDVATDPLKMVASDRPPGLVAHYFSLEHAEEADHAYLYGLPGLVAYDLSGGGLDYLGKYPDTIAPTDFVEALVTLPGGYLASVRSLLLPPTFMENVDLPPELTVLKASDPADITPVATLPLNSAADVVRNGELLYVTDPYGQLTVIDVAEPMAPKQLTQLQSFHTPRGAALDGDALYVVDLVLGLVTVDVRVPTSPEVVAVTPVPGSAQRVVAAGDVLWVASGGAGFHAFDVSNPLAPQLLSRTETGRSVAGLSATKQRLWTAEHEVITAWDVSDPSAPIRLRSAVTPWMALDVLALPDGEVLVADWEQVQRWHLDSETLHPQLELQDGQLALVQALGGAELELRNVGAATLEITGMAVDTPGYEVYVSDTVVPASGAVDAYVTWVGDGDPPAATLCVASNDPGAPVREIPLHPQETSELGPAIGSEAPDFVLPDLKGNLVSLGDFKGQPVLIVLFATWCPVCHFELADLELGLWTEYKDKGFQVLAIGGASEGLAAVQEFAAKYNLTFPILYDDSQMVLDAYRFVKMGVPGTVPFPQDFVVGADQRVLWRSNLYDPQAIEALIAPELEPGE